MKTQLNIPSKIRVGFQRRSGTYTNKLAYVIYYDSKGKLRKEPSFESWRHKVGHDWLEWNSQTREHEKGKHGKDMEPINYDNVPTEGFVLNKKAGGYSSGWNNRATYCRVFDPRGFEFEISIPNLLFILQETNSIKGKGLEGEFVYSWEGKDIVLLPVGCQEYKASANFTALKTMKVTKKEMVEGCSYLTKDEKEVIYLGRYNWHEMERVDRYTYGDTWVKGAKQHIFVYVDRVDNFNGNKSSDYMLTKGFTGLAKKTSDEPVSNFAEIFDEFSKSRFANKPVEFETRSFGKIKFPEITNSHSSYGQEPKGPFYKGNADGTFTRYNVSAVKNYVRDNNDNSKSKYVFMGYDIITEEKIYMDNDTLRIKRDRGTRYNAPNYNGWSNQRGNGKKLFTADEVREFGFEKLFLKLEKGNKIEINKY